MRGSMGASTTLRCYAGSGVPSRPLRQDENKQNDYSEDHPRRQRTTESQSAMACRLVEKVSDGRTERSRQYESRPEQEYARNSSPIIQCCQYSESCAEHESASIISQPRAIRRPIFERGPEGLRKRDRHPIEDFHFRRCNGLNIYRAESEVPNRERAQDARQQNRRASRVADAQ